MGAEQSNERPIDIDQLIERGGNVGGFILAAPAQA